MTFALRTDQSVAKGIRRVVRKQIDNALEQVANGARAKSAEVVHNARKRFKKIRSVLRLVRADLGPKVYRRENACFRDAARPLSAARDAQVLVDTLDELTRHFADQVTRRAFAEVRRFLVAHRREVRRRVLEEDRGLAKVASVTRAARRRVEEWTLRHKGWRALRGGLEQVYRDGRQAFCRAAADPSVENLHEWRKQVKYLWHQIELFEPTWPPLMTELANQAHELANHLGDDHDLAVLRQFVTDRAGELPDGAALETLVALIDRRRCELQQTACPLGQRLYGEKPKAFVDRIETYWRAWRREANQSSEDRLC